MNYIHTFQVKASLEDVREFHSQSSSMAAITPPPVIVQMHRTPDLLKEGDEMEFTLWLGPFPLRWLARIEQVTPTSFVDRQLRGPFTKWVHKHTFKQVDDQTIEVHDEITAELGEQWLWKIAGMGMWLNMPILFAYRGWKTRRILERKQADVEQLNESPTT